VDARSSTGLALGVLAVGYRELSPSEMALGYGRLSTGEITEEYRGMLPWKVTDRHRGVSSPGATARPDDHAIALVGQPGAGGVGGPLPAPPPFGLANSEHLFVSHP
jgi:hypothetical protein